MKGLEMEIRPTHYFAKIKCEPSWKWVKRHQPFEHYDLFYVWDGIGVVEVEHEQYEVRHGSCLLFRPGDRPSTFHDPQRPLTITYVHFHLDEPSSLLPRRFQVLQEPIEMEVLLGRYVHLRLSKRFGAEEESNLILKQILIQLMRNEMEGTEAAARDTRALQDAVYETANYMHEHPSGWFSVEQLAERAQLSAPYFSRKFKQMMGMTVREYAVRCRMERAQALLRFGGMKVTEVADALGYKDVYFFSRQYKQHTGRSPSSDR